MISITVSGLLVAKPCLQLVGDRDIRKCEFTVFDMRRVRVSDTWQPVWERAVFVAWDDEADRVALIMSKGAHVTCTGLQETQQWTDQQGVRRLSVTYRLTAWKINYRQRWPVAAGSGECNGLQRGARLLDETPQHCPHGERTTGNEGAATT